MSEETVLIPIDPNPPKALPLEPLVEDDLKLHGHPKPQEVQLPTSDKEVVVSGKSEETKPTIKRVLKPWYEMVDHRK